MIMYLGPQGQLVMRIYGHNICHEGGRGEEMN